MKNRHRWSLGRRVQLLRALASQWQLYWRMSCELGCFKCSMSCLTPKSRTLGQPDTEQVDSDPADRGGGPNTTDVRCLSIIHRASHIMHRPSRTVRCRPRHWCARLSSRPADTVRRSTPAAASDDPPRWARPMSTRGAVRSLRRAPSWHAPSGFVATGQARAVSSEPRTLSSRC